MERKPGIRSVNNRLDGRGASLLCLLGGIAILLNSLHPSQTQELWIYSYFRWVFLALILTIIVYFLISSRIRILAKINTFLVVALFSNAVLLECIFQLFPVLIPTKLIILLPPELRTKVAIERGLMTEQTMMGKGMLYSRNPAIYNKTANPWAKVDQDGYRNPTRPTKGVDLVIFGDSVMFAGAVKKDLAERFRNIGVPAYNLAMAGYSPFHFLDAYQKFVISRNLFHKKVLLFISTPNDFTDASRYLNIKNGGGDYRAYLGQGGNEISSVFDKLPLHVPAILSRTPSFLKAEVSSLRNYISRLAGPRGEIRLPYAKYPAAATNLDIFDKKTNTASWINMTKALTEIIE